MMGVSFRNIVATPDDPVADWGVEGIVTAIERGGSSEWDRIMAEVDLAPDGGVADLVACALDAAQDSGARTMIARALRRARSPHLRAIEDAQVWITCSLMPLDELAAALGCEVAILQAAKAGQAAPPPDLLDRLAAYVQDLQAARREADSYGIDWG